MKYSLLFGFNLIAISAVIVISLFAGYTFADNSTKCSSASLSGMTLDQLYGLYNK